MEIIPNLSLYVNDLGLIKVQKIKTVFNTGQARESRVKTPIKTG